MDPRETVAALRSGDPTGLRMLHGAYAGRLYDYAIGMVHDREAAEDAVHDALLVAADRARGLREPERLTAWLYAITRNECLRQARRSRVAARPRPVDTRDATIYLDLKLEQTRAWIKDAAAGLSAGNREALDLTLRHGLREDDLAAVLGIKPKRAGALVAAAREALDEAVASLSTARAGIDGCPELDALLAGWNGLFTREVHERVSRHAARCTACAAGPDRRGGASAVYAELPFATPPRGLFERVLATAEVPDRIAYRGEIAEPFLRSGFPVPLNRSPGHRRMVNLAAAFALVALIGGLWYALRPSTTVRTASESVPPPGIESIAPAVSVTPTPSASATPSAASPSPSPSPTRASPSAARGGNSTPDGVRANRRGAERARTHAVLQDATTGCPSRWRATVTTFVQGTDAREVTFVWGDDSDLDRRVELAALREGVYQETVGRLPMDEEISWRVDVVTEDGTTVSTPVRETEHRRQC